LTYAQTFAEKITAHLQRYQRDSIPLSDNYYRDLSKIQQWLSGVQLSKQGTVYFDYLEKYLTFIQPSTYRKYVAQMHDDIISKSLEILQTAHKEDIPMRQYAFSLLPEYYPAVKVLFPPEDASDAVMNMARERPQELIGQFSWLDYSNDNKDLLLAMTLSPHLFSQFMHYNNNVKKVIMQSKDIHISLMRDIYARYRYSNQAYYLLPYIAAGKITIDEAEAIAKQEHLLLDYLAPMVADSQLLASQSVREKWGELTGNYLRKVKYYKSFPVNEWDMDALEKVSDTTRVMLLFINHGLLSPTELEAFMRWVSLRHFLKPLPPKTLDKLSLYQIYSLKNRVEEQQLKVVWGQLWGADSLKTYLKKRWEELTPTQLNALQNQLSIQTPNIQANIPAKQKVPEYFIQKYYFNLPEEEKVFIKLKNDPLTALEKIKDWLNEPYAPRLLQHIASSYPLDLIQHLEDILLKPYGIEALKSAAKTAPLTAKNFIIQPAHPWNLLFKTSVDSVMKTLYRIDKEAGINTRAYLLLDDIYKGKLSIKDADSICQKTNLLTSRLIDIASRPDALGRYSIQQELSAIALKFVRNLNISENIDNYFNEQLTGLTAKELYTFMTYGEDEIIESSFRKMLQYLLMSLPESNVYPLMESLGFNEYRKFLRKCSYYGLSERIFSRMTEQQRSRLARRLLDQLELGSEEDAVLMADMIISLDYAPMTDLLHQQLKFEYERCEKARLDKGVAIYGVLSSLLSLKVDNGWAKYVAEKYELPALERLPLYDLFNQQMTNIQQYFFYNDEDGIASYNNFIRSYEKSPLEWEIKDLGAFIVIRSKAGRRVEIYANKAWEGEKGIEAMIEYLKKNKLEPQIVAHRGLSTHTLKTFTRMPESARLILDGSCGGYHVQQVAIQRAPGAQILCNRNVGTMHINDPMFKQISDEIRNGRDISWPEFWSKMSNRVGSNPYFRDYIPPHKNTAAILLKTLYEVLEIH
jgi:hypothetical protein